MEVLKRIWNTPHNLVYRRCAMFLVWVVLLTDWVAGIDSTAEDWAIIAMLFAASAAYRS